MKKLLIAAVALLASFSSQAIGLESAGIANHLGVDVNLSTNGIGFEVATPVTRFVQARLGLSIMPSFGFDTSVETDVDGIYNYSGDMDTDIHGSFKRVQGHLIFNVYPFPVGSFYVAAGAYFGGRDLIKITGHNDAVKGLDDAGVVIGDYKLPFDKNGDIKGGLRVNAFRPYLGIGWGRPVPNRRINFGVELGVQFQGKPKLYADGHDDILSEINDLDEETSNTITKVMDHFTVWPVLKFTLSGKIF